MQNNCNIDKNVYRKLAKIADDRNHNKESKSGLYLVRLYLKNLPNENNCLIGEN
jgi:hypothetical protein